VRKKRRNFRSGKKPLQDVSIGRNDVTERIDDVTERNEIIYEVIEWNGIYFYEIVITFKKVLEKDLFCNNKECQSIFFY